MSVGRSSSRSVPKSLSYDVVGRTSLSRGLHSYIPFTKVKVKAGRAYIFDV